MAKSRHRHKTKGRSLRPLVSSKLKRGLDEAAHLIKNRKYEEAITLLTGLREQYPDNYDVRHQLAAASHEAGDEAGYLTHCHALVAMKPNDPYLRLILSTAYIKNGRLVLTYVTNREFLERWPDHPEADQLRETWPTLEKGVQVMLNDVGLQGEEGIVAAAQHEEVQHCLQAGLYAEGISTALDLIERHPQYAPVHNNLSLIYFYYDQPDEALDHARQVLAFDPVNLQATANLARMLFFKGDVAEAQAQAEKLKGLRSHLADYWTKQAETFSYLGDDISVLETHQKAQAAGMFESDKVDPAAMALLHHLAGASAAHLGDEAAAQRYWQQAVQAVPRYELASVNLADLKKPDGQRYGPYAFHAAYWIPRQWMDHLSNELKAATTSETALAAINTRLRKSFDLAHLAPILLARSDERAADVLLTLAQLSKHPELLATVKDFALGQRGSDQIRHRAVQMLAKAGVIPGGEIEMWVRGKRGKVVLFNMSIINEPTPSDLPPKAQRLGEKGFFAMQDQRWDYAEQLFLEALKYAPDAPSLRNNLAAAYSMQGRDAEHLALMESLCADHPDYFFGIIYRARTFTEKNQLDEAQKLLSELLQQPEMHTTEFVMLATAQVELSHKRGERYIAEQWFQMFERIAPDHPNVAVLRHLLWPPKIDPQSDMMSELARLMRSRRR